MASIRNPGITLKKVSKEDIEATKAKPKPAGSGGGDSGPMDMMSALRQKLGRRRKAMSGRDTAEEKEDRSKGASSAAEASVRPPDPATLRAEEAEEDADDGDSWD